jgi:hypothetical protein
MCVSYSDYTYSRGKCYKKIPLSSLFRMVLPLEHKVDWSLLPHSLREFDRVGVSQLIIRKAGGNVTKYPGNI